MLGEVDDLDEPAFAHWIPMDEAAAHQGGQRFVHIDLVGWKDFHLDLAGAIFETPFPVSQGPEPNEEQASGHRQLDEFVIGEEPWLDISGASHA
jgi:hypothetical protein